MKRSEIVSQALRDTGSRSFAEVGVWRGELAAEVLRLTPQLETYWLIDDWQNPADAGHRQAAIAVANSDERFKLIERRSVAAAGMFKPGEIDGVYIDACHDFDSVAEDILAWWPAAAKWIGGHDYVFWNTCVNVAVGVIPAVEMFAAARDLTVFVDWQPGNISWRLWHAHNAGLTPGVTGDTFPSWFIPKDARTLPSTVQL